MSYTDLELASMEAVPAADDLAGTWDVRPNPHPASEAEREGVLAAPGFGKQFSDHMAHAVWTPDKGWHDFRIEAYGPLSMDPAGAVLHYGQETFEGLKAYRHEDGSIWTFRPTYNAARLNHSNRRLAIPELEHEAYFANGFQPIDVWVERDFHRAGPGGMGDAKTGGNYASSLLPKTIAHEGGYDEVMFLDAATDTNIDELGGMNVFVVMSDGSIRTPKLTGNILAGCTRSSILQLLHDDGADVREETLALADVLAGIESGAVAEMFACGTAAVITSIGSLSGKDFRVEIPRNEVTRTIYDRITGIQLGKVEDRHGWLYRLA